MIEQTSRIRAAEQTLGVGPAELARQMGTPYHTLKDWKAGRRKMPGIAYRCLDLLEVVRAAGMEV